MTFTFKLERLDGTPADPPSYRTTVYRWSPGDRIPLWRDKALQVVRVSRPVSPTPPLRRSSRDSSATNAPQRRSNASRFQG
jgi:hypothetical protein